MHVVYEFAHALVKPFPVFTPNVEVHNFHTAITHVKFPCYLIIFNVIFKCLAGSCRPKIVIKVLYQKSNYAVHSAHSHQNMAASQ
jgi:hypothetical protein